MKFSIIIPTYNRANFISYTIDSILKQKHSDFELIIVDDGSTDETEKVVSQIHDSRLTYFKIPNGERGAARNYGARKATGEYLNFFDSDDLAYPNHLSTAISLIEKTKSPEIFHLAYDGKMPDGTLVKTSKLTDNINRHLIRDNVLSCNGVFLRRDIALKFPFEEDRRMSVAEDWALWLRLASRYKILQSNEITSSIIYHDQRSVFDYNLDKIITRDELLIESLLKDDSFTSYYKKDLSTFISDKYTFFALLASLNKDKKIRSKTLSYLFSALKHSPKSMLSKRFLASLKHYILRPSKA